MMQKRQIQDAEQENLRVNIRVYSYTDNQPWRLRNRIQTERQVYNPDLAATGLANRAVGCRRPELRLSNLKSLNSRNYSKTQSSVFYKN